MNNYESAFELIRFTTKLIGFEFAFFEVQFWDSKPWLIVVYFGIYGIYLLTPIDIALYSRQYLNLDHLIQLTTNVNIIMMILGAIAALPIIVIHKSYLIEATNTLKKFHLVEVQCLKLPFKRLFDEAYRRINLLSKVMISFAPVALVSLLIFNSILMYFLHDSPYPLPIFYEVAFMRPVTNWLLYGLNMLYIAVAILVMSVPAILYGLYHFLVMILIGTKLESIKITVEEIESVTQELNSFDGWLKNVVDSLDSCRYILKYYAISISGYFYFYEKLNYMCLFMAIVILKTDAKFIGISLTGLTFVACLTIVVALNEWIVDKFEDLEVAIYDLPWYELKPENRRKLVILIQAAQNPIVMSSGGISDMTLEWYSDLIKKSYSASLILQDFLYI